MTTSGVVFMGELLRLDEYEKLVYAQALSTCKTLTEMADKLGVGRSTVYRRLKHYGLPIPPLRDRIAASRAARARKDELELERLRAGS